jgi:hypothetical protein
MPKLPISFQCEECRKLARALQLAWQTDKRALRTKLADAAASSGRDPRQFGVSWVFSVATMPDDEMRILLESHYPNVAEAKRQAAEHETSSGHSVRGWAMLSQYASDETD